MTLEERASNVRTVVFLWRERGSDISEAIEELHPDDREHVKRAWTDYLISRRRLNTEIHALEIVSDGQDS